MCRPSKTTLKTIAFLMCFGLLPQLSLAQIDQGQTGLWSMYFWNASFDDSVFGAQGDIQYRQWEVGEDLEQLLLRGGLTWRPKSMQNTLLTLGYANITSGTFGPSDAQSTENRIYQEALLGQKPASWLHLRHRFRFEQRWVEDQDFRTRFRYAIFADVPLNGIDPGPGSIYLSLYNEVFVNGERDIGGDNEVQLFDRNRSYAALGYGLNHGLRVQAGYMHQESANFGKGQLQLSLHQNF